MSGSLPSTTEVCIVGAGPSGLSCALALAARQIPFVIVDALSEAHNDSRTIVLFPSGLEALKTVDSQIPANILSVGVKGEAFRMRDRNGKTVFTIPFEPALKSHTQYPFALIVRQDDVERQLRKSLPNHIHFNSRVCGVSQVAEGSQYELQFESGHVLTARYVVAADGSKSFLRTFAGIPFVDPITKKPAAPGRADKSFVVADVVFEKLPTNLPREILQIKVADEGFVMTGPMVDSSLPDDLKQNLFRLYLNTVDIPPPNPDITYLQGILDARGAGLCSTPLEVPRIGKLLSSSRFRTRNALADSYVHAAPGGAYILLAGDSAHTHGPGGGQGMSLGIGDGVELGQAIDEHRTAVLGGKNDVDAASIFHAYSTRRRAIARQVIVMVTDMSQVEAGSAGWGPYLRIWVVWMLTKLPIVRRMMAWQISGLANVKKQ
ncbi:FAD/NAD(P)-binding domain-containing protein [Roridomyces roridus]|uniref:FAD/NAD(P)-binding domain-containing protein n=1 Tax=Roridomyces roridus TaxID=1738132 RepID=A0AAD7C5C6_9AGAR|nr:FAD/NAD(P)-binding domain-containing protein [Roridomyces roridus]